MSLFFLQTEGGRGRNFSGFRHRLIADLLDSDGHSDGVDRPLDEDALLVVPRDDHGVEEELLRGADLHLRLVVPLHHL